MKKEVIKVSSRFYRNFTIRKAEINKDSRSVDLTFSSEHPVRRSMDTGDVYNEILDHNPDSVIMDRLNAGAPLLMHHDSRDQVGIVEKAMIGDDKRGHATVRFGNTQRAQEIFQDVQDGIRKNVSVGYQVHGMDSDEDDPEDDNGVENLRCRWEPLEISLESLPADHTVGVGRNKPEQIEIPLNRNKTPMKSIRTRNLSPAAADGNGVTITEAEVKTRTADAAKAERLRASSILSLGQQHKIDEKEIRSFIDEGKSEDDFVRHILTSKTNATPIPGKAAIDDSIIGMSRKEKDQYSIIRAIRQMAVGKLDGLEKEAHDAAVKRSGRPPQSEKSFVIPEDVIRAKFRGEGWQRGRVTRDMQAGIFSQGGAFVETEVLGSALIELLRNKMQTVNAGARTMSGLQNNVAIPRQSAGATAYWIGEIQSTPESDQALQQLLLTPHRLAARTNYSNLLLAQSTLDAEAFIRSDLMKQLAIAKDLAGMSGTGGAQPIGIINTTGVGTQSVTAGTPTWAQMVGFETVVAAANADFGSLTYIVSTAARGLLKTTAKIGSTFPIYLWDTGSAPGEGSINGYRALATNQLNTAANGNKMIYGNWDDLIYADWEGWEVLVDPYTLSDQGEVRCTIFNFCDVGVRHPGSFCYSPGSVI